MNPNSPTTEPLIAKIIKDGVDQAIASLGNQIWMQSLRETQRWGNINTMSMEELNVIMGHTFQLLPYFPSHPYLTSS
ncbi:hypothetical protein KY284_035958 [Solanum tuberosum]|nr:hypothetical protein KY284_035958 [Solanum tuberosum]